MGKLQQFTMTRVGWTSLVDIAVARALEISKTRALDHEVMFKDIFFNMPDVPSTSLPRLIREALQIISQINAKNG